MSEYDAHIDRGIEVAIEMAKNKTFSKGDVVAHQNEALTFAFVKEKDGIITMEIPAEISKTGKRMVKKYPKEEVFDPHDVETPAFMSRDGLL